MQADFSGYSLTDRVAAQVLNAKENGKGEDGRCGAGVIQRRPDEISRDPEMTIETHLARIRAKTANGERLIIGLTGAPGAGKSTLAQMLIEQLGSYAVFVPMDGYHLANTVFAQ